MFDPEKLASLLATAESAVTAHEKGAQFERLAMYLFEHFDGVEVAEHAVQMRAEEIDIVLWNAQREEVLRPWDAVILVECKNWSARVGAGELDRFIAKLRRRSLKTGMFVAAAGVTGGFIAGDGEEVGAAGIMQNALQEGIRVIVITIEDIRRLRSLNDLRTLIKKRYCGLYVHRFL